MQALQRLLLTASLSATAAMAASDLPPVQYTPNGAPKCPRDLDIKNMETRMSALVVPPKNQIALQQEKAKATTCRLAGAEYTPADWTRMNAVIRGDD